MAILETVKTTAYKKVWGEHSLTVGELVGFAIGLRVIWFNWFGKWSFWIGLAVLFIAMALF